MEVRGGACQCDGQTVCTLTVCRHLAEVPPVGYSLENGHPEIREIAISDRFRQRAQSPIIARLLKLAPSRIPERFANA